MRAKTLATAEAVTVTLSNGESGSSIPIPIAAVGPPTTVINPVTLVSDTTITGRLGPEPVGRVTAQSVHPNRLSISMAYEIISVSKTVFLSET